MRQKSKQQPKLIIESASTYRGEKEETTVVFLTDGEDKYVGRATLQTVTGLDLHKKFENAIKLIIK